MDYGLLGDSPLVASTIRDIALGSKGSPLAPTESLIPRPRPEGLGVRDIDTQPALDEALANAVGENLRRSTLPESRQRVVDAVVPVATNLQQPVSTDWDRMVDVNTFLSTSQAIPTLPSSRTTGLTMPTQTATAPAMGILDNVIPEGSTQGAGIEMVPADGQATDEQPDEDTPAVSVTDSGGSDVDAKAASTRESIDAINFATLKIGDERINIPEAAHLTTMFNGLADVEGDFNHVDGRGYFTMPYGVVPDNGSVKRADGTAFNPRSGHGYTTDTAGNVDTSNATHTLKINDNTSYTVRRADYDSDEAFARGVVGLYNREAQKIYGEGWDDLTEGARSMALDMAWNGGVGAVGWSSVRNAMQEAGKENPNTTTLFGFTANIRSGENYPRGLFKRRLIQYNMIANPADVASTYSTEALTRNNVRVGTRYIAHRADGTNIGSWDRYDAADNPATKANEKRVASNETIAANVGLD